MRHSSLFLPLTLLTLGLLTIASGCKPKPPTITPSEVERPSEPEPARPQPPSTEVKTDFPTEKFDEPEENSVDIWNQMGVLQTIYFALDSAELTSQAIATLRENAEWLKAHGDLHVVIEGHCDERGSIEYNLALGQRRADSVRTYLTTLGVDRSRIRAKTYGEEQPVDPGHSEAAWSKNRRGAFVLER